MLFPFHPWASWALSCLAFLLLKLQEGVHRFTGLAEGAAWRAGQPYSGAGGRGRQDTLCVYARPGKGEYLCKTEQKPFEPFKDIHTF